MYYEIWSYDRGTGWTFHGYSYGSASSEQLTRALNRQNISAGSGPVRFAAYPSRKLQKGKRYNWRGFHEVYAYGRPPSSKKYVWGWFGREESAMLAAIALGAIFRESTAIMRVEYSNPSGKMLAIR